MNVELLKRYTPTQQFEIMQFFKVLAERTRKSKRIAPKRKENIMKSWEVYHTDVVLDALNSYVKIKYSSTYNENYVKGIMRNKQREKEARLG
ncbi:MAG: hypothetical protein ACRCW1_01585, partial [Anaerotignaceae bacterium]